MSFPTVRNIAGNVTPDARALGYGMPRKKRAKRKYMIHHSDTTGLWYAIPIGVTFGFGWRQDKRVKHLGYPKKDAYKLARKLGLID